MFLRVNRHQRSKISNESQWDSDSLRFWDIGFPYLSPIQFETDFFWSYE